MLSMNVQQGRSQLAKSGDSAWLIVDVDTIALVGGDFTADDDLVTVAVQTKTLQLGLNVRLKNSFDEGPCFAAADHLCRRFGAGEESQSVHDDRLAGSGFAGQQAETGFEMNLKFVDECEVSYSKKAQHALAFISYRS